MPSDPRLWPKVPFRIEEWGKSERFLEMPGGGIVLARGPKPGGALVSFIGKNTETPLPYDPGVARRVVLEGFAENEKDANERVRAFVRAKLAERSGKARQRAADRA